MLQPGDRIGDYQVVEAVGEGGMARVYKVRHQVLHSVHAIKVLNPQLVQSQEHRQRFLEEGRIQASLRHPNICPVVGLVSASNTAGLVMEWMDGEDLFERLERAGALDAVDGLRVVDQVLSALEFVHTKGVVHRDLKPGNVFLHQMQDGTTRTRVMDFGVAKVAGKNRTRTRGAFGTVSYMSPEQIRSPRSVDLRTDLFAVGCLLFEVLSAEPAYESSESDFETQSKIVSGQHRSLDVLEDDLAAIVAMAIQRDPARRFPTASEFRAAIGVALHRRTAAPVRTVERVVEVEVERRVEVGRVVYKRRKLPHAALVLVGAVGLLELLLGLLLFRDDGADDRAGQQIQVEAESPSVDAEACASAVSKDTVQSWESYRRYYPGGICAEVAAETIVRLEVEASEASQPVVADPLAAPEWAGTETRPSIQPRREPVAAPLSSKPGASEPKQPAEDDGIWAVTARVVQESGYEPGNREPGPFEVFFLCDSSYSVVCGDGQEHSLSESTLLKFEAPTSCTVVSPRGTTRATLSGPRMFGCE